MVFDSLDIKIGHASDLAAHTGCSVFLLPEGVTVSVDVRGPAPGSRESALLQPLKPISYAHAILLTGGSAFGLAAADGVMHYLAENGIGHPTPVKPIPLVAASVIYDLFFNGGQQWPTRDMALAACHAAICDNCAQGNVGVGAGATVGKWGGFPGFMKGGVGIAQAVEGDLKVWAAVVSNALGDVVNEDGTNLAGAEVDGRWKADSNPHRLSRDPRPTSAENTTLAVVATNAKLDKVQAHRLAQRAHDGMAMAIRPIHTSHDGDTAYGVATNKLDAPYDWAANMAADCVATAIRNSVRAAETVGAVRGLKRD